MQCCISEFCVAKEGMAYSKLALEVSIRSNIHTDSSQAHAIPATDRLTLLLRYHRAQIGAP